MIPSPGREDIEAEIHVMTSILSKELGMMEAQLEIWKETAYEAISLREKVQSLKVMLSEKVLFHCHWILFYPTFLL